MRDENIWSVLVSTEGLVCMKSFAIWIELYPPHSHMPLPNRHKGRRNRLTGTLWSSINANTKSWTWDKIIPMHLYRELTGWVCRKGLCGPGGQGTWVSGVPLQQWKRTVHWLHLYVCTRQVKGRDYFFLFGTCETASGVLVPSLGFSSASHWQTEAIPVDGC